MHLPWTSIELFHNVRRTFREITPEGPHTASYRAKVKLHGTNAAVQVTPEGVLECQSRERIITPEDDNYGFAAFAQENREFFLDVAKEIGPIAKPDEIRFAEALPHYLEAHRAGEAAAALASASALESSG